MYDKFVSDEDLDVIRANECESHVQHELRGPRFRRLFNEIDMLRAELDHAVATIEDRNAELSGRDKGWVSFWDRDPEEGQQIEISMDDRLYGTWNAGLIATKIRALKGRGIDAKWRPCQNP